MTNAVLQAIADRRSNRGYAPRQLTEEELQAILTAALQSPSARNTQPWHFSVVQNAGLLKEFSLDYNRLQKSDPGRDILFFEAPTVVFISTPVDAPTRFSQIDCGLSLIHISRAISPHRCFKSMTVPVPSRFTAFSWNTPLGSRFSANLPYSLMTVCPALLPP